MNRRGVGILLKRSSSFSVLAEWRDRAENFLLLKVKKTGSDSVFFIGSIYGPNRYEPAFFEEIRQLLGNCGNAPIIIYFRRRLELHTVL
jgi:hypothetical protein